MSKIKFGTDGWRAIMAEDFTFDNVRAVAQGIASYLIGKGQAERGIVIGYDNRFLAEHFAKVVGEVMAGNQIPVFITGKATPTPVTAFAIVEHQAAGAVMLTASHNPPEYNGIKFIPDYAGPALPEITNEIERLVFQALENKEIKRTSEEDLQVSSLWREINPKQSYLAQLRGLIDVDTIKNAGLKVVIDPMYGAGIGYLEDFLKEAGCDVTVLHGWRDTLFGGSLPEPTAEMLGDLRAEVTQRGAWLGLALDGDADRFGIIDVGGAYISPNQVLVLLYEHLLNHKGLTGPVARTVATTHLLDRIAEYHGLAAFETPVGFKYIGQLLREKGCIIGGEESGGLSIKGHLPEKDGILAAGLIAELVAVTGESLRANLEEIYQKYGRLISRRLDIRVRSEAKTGILELLRDYQPVKMAGIPVTGRLLVDGTKLLLADGSMILIRPSGTEPLFRIYVETDTEEKLLQMQKETREELGI